MSHIADSFTVILDANVLFPFRQRDILLSFYETGLFRARWSEEILDEWTRNLLRIKPHLADSIQSQLAAMRTTFPEAIVTGHQSLIQAVSLPDPNDRHVLVAAIVSGAQHIVTENLKDFPDEYLSQFSIEAVSVDDFLSRTFELYPAQALASLRAIRNRCFKPPFTPAEFVFYLNVKGMPKLAARLRDLREFL